MGSTFLNKPLKKSCQFLGIPVGTICLKSAILVFNSCKLRTFFKKMDASVLKDNGFNCSAKFEKLTE